MRIVQGYYEVFRFTYSSQEAFYEAMAEADIIDQVPMDEPPDDLPIEARQWRGGREFYLHNIAWKSSTYHALHSVSTVMEHENFHFDADDADMMERELQWACEKAHTDYIAALVRHGAQVNPGCVIALCDRSACDSLFPCIAFLFERVVAPSQADLNAMLHEAAWRDNFKTVAYVVARGADIHSRPTYAGHTSKEIPCQSEEMREHLEIVAVAQQRQALHEAIGSSDEAPRPRVACSGVLSFRHHRGRPGRTGWN